MRFLLSIIFLISLLFNIILCCVIVDLINEINISSEDCYSVLNNIYYNYTKEPVYYEGFAFYPRKDGSFIMRKIKTK